MEIWQYLRPIILLAIVILSLFKSFPVYLLRMASNQYVVVTISAWRTLISDTYSVFDIQYNTLISIQVKSHTLVKKPIDIFIEISYTNQKET